MVNDVEQHFWKFGVRIIMEEEYPDSVIECRHYTWKGVRVGRSRICTGIQIWTCGQVETRRKEMVVGQKKLGSRCIGWSFSTKIAGHSWGRPDKTGADRNGLVSGSKSAGVERGAMDSKQRSSGKPSSALNEPTECCHLGGVKCLERTRHPYKVRTKASKDCRRGGLGMNSFECCRDTGELQMKEDDARDQEELWE
ncbi:hypothetical protein C8R43DRAFT_946788 [Mycena crocata]|nr:hypothetical protein C8R43DRAFT_946788 [Mycena crocata]